MLKTLILDVRTFERDVVTSIGTLWLLDGAKFWLQRRRSDHLADNEKLEIILV